MARGDLKWFAAFEYVSKAGVAFNLTTNTLKVAVITNAQVPTVGTNDPRWGAGGTVNFSTAQVGTATGYTGPITLTGVTYTRTGGVVKFDHDDIVIPLDAVGFTDGYSLIYYNATIGGNYCFAFADLGGPVSIVGGALNINVNASGALTETAT